MKQRIVQGTKAELNERGIKFTMDDLARRLKMSKRTLYEHFSSKEDLVGSLMAEAVEEMKGKSDEILCDDTLDIKEKFRRMITLRPTLSKEWPENLAIDIKKSMPGEWEKLQISMNEIWEKIEDLLEEGATRGCFRPVFFPAVRVILRGAFNEYGNYKFLMEHKVTLHEMIDSVLDILMYGIVVQPDHETMRRKQG